MEPRAGGEAEENAARALEAGGVVGLPTDTVYGLAALAGQSEGIARLFSLKGRPQAVAIAVLVASTEQALALADDRDSLLETLAGAFWPGPLTIVARRASGLGYRLGGDEESIGLRCPDDDLVQRLASAIGPLAVTSANRHGEPPATSAGELAAAFPGVPVLDGGRRAAAPSSVVSVRSGAPELLRAGVIDLAALAGALAGRGGRGGARA